MDILNSAMQFLGSQFSWSSAKAACAVILAGIFSLFSTAASLAHPSIPFLVALVCIDFALAAGIALQENRFTWPGFRHGLGKFVAYGLIFIVTGLADSGIGVSGWPLNLTVGMSCWAIAGETVSCLRHIDHIFPGRLPVWVIERLLTFQNSIERDNSGHDRRQDDWRGYWRAGEADKSRPFKTGGAPEEEVPADCRGRIPEDRQEGGPALSRAEGDGLQGRLCRPQETSPTGSVRTGRADRPLSEEDE